MGKLLIIAGIIILTIGLIIQFGPKVPFLGKLPGDISIKKENYSVYFPITTSILLSILLSVIVYLINRFKN